MKNNILPDLLPLAVTLDRLSSLENNPRRGDVEAVSKSYDTFGQRKPIVVRKTGKNSEGDLIGEILAGNHQFQAAKKLGWDKIAVVWVEDDDATAAAFAVADNRVGLLGEWDTEKLFASLDGLDSNLLEATGFSLDDLDDISALLEEGMFSMTASEQTKNNEAELGKDVDGSTVALNLAERLDVRNNRTSRQIVLDLQMQDYIKTVKLFNKYREDEGCESNGEAVIKLLENHFNNKGSK